jgi:hypothetical protein
MSQAMRDRYLKRGDVQEINFLSIRKTIGNNERIIISVDVSFERILKNGKLKTEEGDAYLTANFCPFCGEKYGEIPTE